MTAASGPKPTHGNMHHSRHLNGPLLSARGAMKGRQLREMRSGMDEHHKLPMGREFGANIISLSLPCIRINRYCPTG